MSALTVLGVFNYGLVLLYGLFLSTFIAGGWTDRRQKALIFAVCPLFLLAQSLCWLLLGVDMSKQLYPFIVHLPLALILIFILKKKIGVALVSVCTAYLCCQLPRWVSLMVTAVTHSALIGEVFYTLVIGPIFYLLYRFFVRPAHAAMTASPQSLTLFGSLPAAYYFFDYATVVYSDALYRGDGAINEFLPTVLIIFYVMFLTAYHAQANRRAQAEMQSSMLEAGLKQSQIEVDALRRTEMQTAIYQHDMRHHLNMLEGLLTAGKPDQAAEYIRRVQADVEVITPRRYCENELVDLLCSSFSDKAHRMGVRLTVRAKLPRSLSVSDTELCSVLSNALENALHAAAQQDEADRWVELYCGIRLEKLLIEVKNPCSGTPVLRDGIPVSAQAGHGYGCRSLKTIAERHGGLCTFSAENGIFLLRFMLPVKGVSHGTSSSPKTGEPD